MGSEVLGEAKQHRTMTQALEFWDDGHAPEVGNWRLDVDANDADGPRPEEKKKRIVSLQVLVGMISVVHAKATARFEEHVLADGMVGIPLSVSSDVCKPVLDHGSQSAQSS